jgi:hypothetical protein
VLNLANGSDLAAAWITKIIWGVNRKSQGVPLGNFLESQAFFRFFCYEPDLISLLDL